MAKKKKTKNNVSRVNSKSESKKIEKQFSEDVSFGSAIQLIIVVFVILLVFYLLTVVILSKKDSSIVSNHASIQYTKILAGESFNQKEKDYYVFYYSMNDDSATNYADLISNYRDKEDHLPIYTVDLNEGLNKRYLSDTENKVAEKASQLKLKGTTLIHFKDHKINEYITSSFENYLDIDVE